MSNYLDIANYTISQFKSHTKRDITIMELVKYMYFAYGYFLAWKDEKLFDEPIEAWQYGPVVRSVYIKYQSTLDTSNIPKKFYYVSEHPEGKKDRLNSNDRDIIDFIIHKYSRFESIILSELTHRRGTPWAQSFQSIDNKVIIPDKIIKEYFLEQIENKRIPF